jgi:hypothetical protein
VANIVPYHGTNRPKNPTAKMAGAAGIEKKRYFSPGGGIYQ